MDERIFNTKAGRTMPDWDRAHRLNRNGGLGPVHKDSATIHRLNSKYMDVSEQPQMMRQFVAGGCMISVFGAICCAGMFFFVLGLALEQEWDHGLDFAIIFALCNALGFSYVTYKNGRDEFFALTRRPIRFHRQQRKLYAIRRRRFSRANELGDITWEIPWDDDTIFCVHRGPQNSEHSQTYHIRCYQVDEQGKVIRGFGIGREWHGVSGMSDLLCQWNYWCWFMNHGPAELPQPLLFLSERESLYESFLYCMYEAGFGLSARMRIILMPHFALLTLFRVLALSTCRAPIWPPDIAKLCEVAPDDPHAQPKGATPVGWAETSQAIEDKRYPDDPRAPTPGWTGETDLLKHAALWVADAAPGNG